MPKRHAGLSTVKIADDIGPAPFWQLIENDVAILIECEACQHRARWTGADLERRFGALRSKNLFYVANKLRCAGERPGGKRCGSGHVRIWPEAGTIARAMIQRSTLWPGS